MQRGAPFRGSDKKVHHTGINPDSRELRAKSNGVSVSEQGRLRIGDHAALPVYSRGVEGISLTRRHSLDAQRNRREEAHVPIWKPGCS